MGSFLLLDELPENMAPGCRDAMECMQKGIFYKELGTDWLKEKGLYTL